MPSAGRPRCSPAWRASTARNRDGCSESDNLFPSVGAGVQYLLKPAQGIVANLEAAVGKDGNKALLFKLGYAW